MAGCQLSDFFTYSERKLPANGATSSNTVDHCKNLADLLNTVLLSKNISFYHILKPGIDGEKGFPMFPNGECIIWP